MADEDVFGVVADVEETQTPDLGTETPPEPEIESEVPPDEAETPPEGTPTPQKGLSRTEIARFLREMADADPDRKPLTKELSSALFGRDAYKEVFPDINEARTLKATFEAIGGEQGLQELQGFKDEFENLDRMLDSGDPKLVDDILAQSPEGFKKIVPYAFQQLQRIDPEAYNSFLNPLLREQVVNSQIGIQLEAVMASLQNNDPELAARRLMPAISWYKNIAEQAQQDKSQMQQRGGMEQPSGRASELDQREYNLNRNEVRRDIATYSLQQARDTLKTYLKGVKLPENAVKDLEGSVVGEIGRSLMADEQFQARMDNLVRTGQLERAMAYAKPFIDKAKAEAAKAVWSTRYGHLRASANPPAGQRRAGVQPNSRTTAPAPSGWMQIPKMPPLDQIDRRQTTQDMMIEHKAVTVDGRRVQWPR